MKIRKICNNKQQAARIMSAASLQHHLYSSGWGRDILLTYALISRLILESRVKKDGVKMLDVSSINIYNTSKRPFNDFY